MAFVNGKTIILGVITMEEIAVEFPRESRDPTEHAPNVLATNTLLLPNSYCPQLVPKNLLFHQDWTTILCLLAKLENNKKVYLSRKIHIS